MNIMMSHYDYQQSRGSQAVQSQSPLHNQTIPLGIESNAQLGNYLSNNEKRLLAH